MKYDLLVFIGRFQPLHMGHQAVIERALTLSEKVLVLVGSSNQARSPRNPFTYEERSTLIRSIYPRVITAPLHDHTYNDSAWIQEVQERVREQLIPSGTWSPNGTADYKVGLIGCNKDHTSYYLKMFPDWGSESVEFVNPLNATSIREWMFEDTMPEPWECASVLHRNTYGLLSNFRQSDEYDKLLQEYMYIQNYRKTWGEGFFLTADTLVQVGGKILLIKRGREYGHGLYALPGGFVGANERFEEAALRELREETNLRVPVPVLRGSIRNRRIYDDPHRSERRRVVTECFHIVLANDTKLPEVRGGDDAEKAEWVNISDISRENLFEDHFHIINHMLGIS